MGEKRIGLWALLACLFLGHAGGARAENGAPDETRLLQQPAVSKAHVVFVYANDLWIAGRAGGTARRLTSHVGRESSPRISPDGKWVAFSGEYEGNADVYVISVDGGAPRRLTWHPDGDFVRDWHPDGKHVLFASRRLGGAPVMRLFLVSVDGGMPESLAVPRVSWARYDEAGKRIAYTPLLDAFGSWKRYRGGRLPPVWIYDPKTHDVEVVPHVEASDTQPCWLGEDVYFLSDREGDGGSLQMNVWRYRPGTKSVEQITRFKEYGVRALASGGGVLAFTVGGTIRTYDPRSKQFERLHVKVQTDGLGRLPRWQEVRGDVREADIAPNGKRAVFSARGEIVTVPREHGGPRNLTRSPGSHERSPAWSPDGKRIAWFSDADGEYKLVVRDRRGREPAKSYDLGGARFYNDPVWSPNGRHVLFSDKGNRIAYLTLKSGKVTDVATSQGSLGQMRPFAVWSRDSKWIAFETRNPNTAYDGISVYELATGKATPITDGFSSADSPAFSHDGKHLFFRASVDSGPRRFGLDLSASAVTRPSGNLYVVVLKKDGEHPFGPRSDEGLPGKKDKGKKGKPRGGGKDGDEREDDGGKKDGGKKDDERKGDGDDDDDEKDGKDEPKGEEEAGEKPADADEEKGGKDGKPKPASIDVDGISQRILALPVDGGDFWGLKCSKSHLLFLDDPRRGAGELKAFDFKSRKVKPVMGGVSAFHVSADGESLLVKKRSGWSITNESGKDGHGVDVEKVKVRVEPETEWPQILRECWRIQRDFFYDPNLHGVDWDAMWERWSALLPDVQHRADLNLLMTEMMGELCCGHEYVSGGEYPKPDAGVPVGLLGADFEVHEGRFRVSRIYEGQNWSPGQRAPLTVPGVDVRVGDYLLEVNGRPVRGDENLYAAFLYTADQPTEIRVSAKPDGSESRTSTVVPLASDGRLRQKAWVEANRRRVDELSGGRLAYVYMPNTAGAGLAAFNRDYYSQLDKQGLILDERFNGGGKVADHVVSILGREVLCYWMNREGWLGRTPFGTLDGPKVMIVNERAGSGGDAMPWMFKKLGIGPLVGTRTWGGLVGISGYPPLMDGGQVTAASFGIMDTNGEWVVENVGVAPDIEVVQWPKEVAAGRDPQLERAVAVALEMLERNPPKPRPGYKPPSKR